MGNGTTCNLHLVKQNAKRKGEVSTRFFFLYSVGFSLFFAAGGWDGGISFYSKTKRFCKGSNHTDPYCRVRPGRFIKLLYGDCSEKKGEPSWDPTCGARPQQQQQEKEGMKQAGVARADLFITTAPLLSPSRTANANVGHLGKK